MKRPTRRGYFALEMTISLILVAMMASLLAVAVSKHGRTSQRLAEQRMADSIAEKTITELQSGVSPPAEPEAQVTVRRLPDAAPPSLAWARIEARYHGRSSTLIGLIPTPFIGDRP